MQTKDYFSGHANIYAAFRPSYPDDLYEFVFKHINNSSAAWDCATGNGQVAQHLSKHFKTVYATDISQPQLDSAIQINNILYSASPAEKTLFENNMFDLITVGQALHWFDLKEFYAEVKRVGKPDGLLAVWGYALCAVNPEIDKQFLNFYHNIVGPYWDSARKVVENEYRDIAFPFAEIPAPQFKIKVNWNLDQFTGYLTSWSATQKFIKAENHNPVEALHAQLKNFWKPEETKQVTFPVFMKLGRIGE